MKSTTQCPFCKLAATPKHERIIEDCPLVFAIREGYPVTEGHSLITPKRHVRSFFELSSDEKSALFGLLGNQQELLFKDCVLKISI